MAYVSATPGLPLEDLLQLTKDTVASDDIFALIAADVLYVDLRAAPLAEPSRVEVFSTPEAASGSRCHGGPNSPRLSAAPLHCGSQIAWDGRMLEVVNLGETSISLLSEHERLTELPISAFETLIRNNRLHVTCDDLGRPGANSGIHDLLSRASEADLRTATYRAGLISQYLDSGALPTSTDVPTRTFFRWLARYRKAEATCASGFLGLLPQAGNRGNHTTKLPELSQRLMQECIERDYETLKQKTKYASWIQLKLACETQGTPTPSYKTFCLLVQQRPAFDQTLKRKGRRASYQLAAFYWELDLRTPRHGDRPFEITHIDHTELDVECIAHLSSFPDFHQPECVKADRQTACFQATQKDLAIVLGKSRRILGRYVTELSEKKVCRVHMGTNQFARTTFEICDAYWPYQKPSRTSVSTEADGYVPSICKYFVSLGCGTGRFGSSDVRAAEKFRERGIPLAVVEDAMLVGACRKFVSWLNGKQNEPIGSLYYFAPLIEEIRQKPISDSYRGHLRSQLTQLSRRWAKSAGIVKPGSTTG
jgi:hypothetical protein